MFQAIIESLLEERIGLSAEAIGSETIAKAVHRCMGDDRISRGKKAASLTEYLARLQTSEEEWEKLVEAVVVPETWFFRNKASFSFLSGYVRFEWLPAHQNGVLRILSIPCSTGEESYSIAMILMDMGLPEEIQGRFHIDAVDISGKALYKAKLGIYGKASFRGEDLSFQERHFDQISQKNKKDKNEKRFKVHARVRNIVRFLKGNLLETQLLADEKPYDVIFCRNLFIYLGESAKKRAMDNIDRLLAKNGILFVGHVERPLVCASAERTRFVWIRQSGVFACRRAGFKQETHDHPDVVQHLTPSEKSSGRSFEKAGTGRQRGSAVVTPRGPHRQTPEYKKMLPPSLRPFTGSHIPQISSSSDDSVETWLNTAQQLADRGFLSEASELCEKYLNEDPFGIQAHFLMGLICHAMGDEERAEEYFNKAIYLDPNHDEAMTHLAFIMEHRGERDRAERLRLRARRILKKEGDD
ncbi:Tetratricopeptide repeat-containing protein, DUF560 [Desulfonema magnum]|uniref:Tetratricopeptide repeat-containing protein, DUF560 n=2 Tax=Desulfonema magnum TaxID=45655 RepID=A0A975BLL7_9BACT|nr:Tetratricopeptide repeat-containing protein, DUF560 [Desulfonema magnum]